MDEKKSRVKAFEKEDDTSHRSQDTGKRVRPAFFVTCVLWLVTLFGLENQCYFLIQFLNAYSSPHSPHVFFISDSRYSSCLCCEKS